MKIYNYFFLFLFDYLIENIFYTKDRFNFSVWKAIITKHRRIMLNKFSFSISHKTFIISKINIVGALRLRPSAVDLLIILLLFILIFFTNFTVHIFYKNLLLHDFSCFSRKRPRREAFNLCALHRLEKSSLKQCFYD